MGCILCYHNVSLEWVSLVGLIEKMILFPKLGIKSNAVAIQMRTIELTLGLTDQS